ncbi:hypothetical protein B296_00046681 [Ensete ventricosum]|uniref:Uncharacterized protein n=1 Tax=Ensete ventricosum TaxID=4639 RepID=A0A426YZ22_ENSVE|nr:hypothetical protein B296_00046681 [Ensete ventricosum]
MRPARPFVAVLHSYVASGAQRFWSRSRVLRHRETESERARERRTFGFRTGRRSRAIERERERDSFQWSSPRSALPNAIIPLKQIPDWFLAGRVLDLRPLPCILSIVLIPRHRMRKQGGFLKKLGSEPAFGREARLG